MAIPLTRMNRKSEARNSKLETNPNYKCSNVQNMEIKLFEVTYRAHIVFVIWVLKIVSDFDIRISNLLSATKKHEFQNLGTKLENQPAPSKQHDASFLPHRPPIDQKNNTVKESISLCFLRISWYSIQAFASVVVHSYRRTRCHRN